jgi:hypothetical protein
MKSIYLRWKLKYFALDAPKEIRLQPRMQLPYKVFAELLILFLQRFKVLPGIWVKEVHQVE